MGSSSRRGLHVAAFVLLSAVPAFAQQIPHGTLTPPIVSRSDPSQRYSLYVPTAYDRERPAPILFVMDYRGRARVAAERFVPAAERFGWIVMSSYNTASDEAPMPTLDALRAMWTDAHDLFAVEDRRAYLAGLSGTARTATWLASHLPGTIAGVIGAAAGFAPAAPPSAETHFLYFATVGNADYNYWEMRELDGRLTALDVPHRMEVFAGVHGWMPPDVAMDAIEWLELRAMQAGIAPVRRDLVASRWTRDVRLAESLEEEGRPIDAARRLNAMAHDFDGLQPAEAIADARAQAARLSTEPELQDEARVEQRAAAAHARRIADAMQVISSAFPANATEPQRSIDETLAALGVADLHRAAAGRDRDRSLASQRLLNELDVQTGFYLPTDALRARDDAHAAFFLELARAINPDDSFAWMLRARLDVRAGRPVAAIDDLERAVALGFRTADLLEHEPDFAALRGNPAFQALVTHLRDAWPDGGR